MRIKKPWFFTISAAVAFVYSDWLFSRYPLDLLGWIMIFLVGAIAAFIAWAVENP